MADPVIVPRDKSLDQVLATEQVLMLIVGSSQRARELAELAAEVSERQDFGDVPRCAVQVTTTMPSASRCGRKSAKRLIPPSSRSSGTEPSSAPSSMTARSTASTRRHVPRGRRMRLRFVVAALLAATSAAAQTPLQDIQFKWGNGQQSGFQRKTTPEIDRYDSLAINVDKQKF